MQIRVSRETPPVTAPSEANLFVQVEWNDAVGFRSTTMAGRLTPQEWLDVEKFVALVEKYLRPIQATAARAEEVAALRRDRELITRRLGELGG